MQGMRAGKHVACTVPWLHQWKLEAIVQLSSESGMKYMMMETVVYAREFPYMKELYDNGDLGKLQFLKASHQQDMDGWPGYWPAPPMHYATHCVGPVLGLGRHEAEYVIASSEPFARKCTGITIPFRCGTTHLKFRNSDLSAGLSFSIRCTPVP